MEVRICNFCKRELCKESLIKKYKFCDRVCYENFRKSGGLRNTRTEEFKENQRKTTTEFHNNKDNKEINQRRSENISKSQNLKYSVILKDSSKYEGLETLLKLQYISDINSIIKLLDLPFTYNEFVRFIEQDKELFQLFKNCKHTRECLREFSTQKFLDLKRDSQKYDHRYIEKKYKLSEIQFFNVCEKHKDIRWGKIDITHRGKESYIEKIVRDFLREENITFEKERYLVHQKYRVDCLLENNKVIEVNGDYWHTNPEVFDRNEVSKLTLTQKDNIIRDQLKYNWIKENNYRLLIIWERDINTRLDWVKQEIRKFAYE